MIFPPNLSVNIPIGNLKIDPERIGSPNSQPISTLFHLNVPVSTRNVTKTPFIVHAAKQIVNASVFINNILYDLLVVFSNIILLFSNYSIVTIIDIIQHAINFSSCINEISVLYSSFV